MTRTLTYLQALAEALTEEMRLDPTVVTYGEDSIGGTGCDGSRGMAWGPTKGLHEIHPGQILDAPITEAAFVGAAVGAAAAGLRPVVDLLFVDFVGVCFDQILNQAAKFRYMSGGKARVPMVVRALYGAGLRRGAQHSQNLATLFVHVPGLKVVMPSSPADAKGLLIQAIRDDDPVIFMEHKSLYFVPGPVPEEHEPIPFGRARVVREGDDVTIVAMGAMVAVAVRAAEELAVERGISCEVLDPRTLVPFDADAVVRSVERTRRLVVVEESYPRCSVASEIVALVCERAAVPNRLAVRRVTCPDSPPPFSPPLEDAFVPDAGDVTRAVESVLRTGNPTVSV